MLSVLPLQEAAMAKKQVVTESEREIVRQGNLNRLVDEQRRVDAEKEAEVGLVNYRNEHGLPPSPLPSCGGRKRR